MTPDWAGAPTAVPYANFGDPQSLNLYAYVRNNPNTGIDVDGHYLIGQQWGPAGPQWDNDIAQVGSNYNMPGGNPDQNPSGATQTSGNGSASPPPTPPGDSGSAQQRTINGSTARTGAGAAVTAASEAANAQPLYCDAGFIKASNAAWMRAGDGLDNTEAGFWVTGTPDSPTYTPLQSTNESMTITNLVVPPRALTLVHTHPNTGTAQPSPGDITNSNKSGLPFYVLSSRGLWLHNPGSPTSTMVRPVEAWLKSCK
jgi:hypothetical protein